MKERDMQHEIRLALGADPRCVFWRNSVGVADVAGRKQRFGLIVGSSDLVGVLNVNGVGVSVFLEVKTARGRLSKEQELFRGCVESKGGVYLVCTSAEQAVALVNEVWERYAKRISQS